MAGLQIAGKLIGPKDANTASAPVKRRAKFDKLHVSLPSQAIAQSRRLSNRNLPK